MQRDQERKEMTRSKARESRSLGRVGTTFEATQSLAERPLGREASVRTAKKPDDSSEHGERRTPCLKHRCHVVPISQWYFGHGILWDPSLCSLSLQLTIILFSFLFLSFVLLLTFWIIKTCFEWLSCLLNGTGLAGCRLGDLWHFPWSCTHHYVCAR